MASKDTAGWSEWHGERGPGAFQDEMMGNVRRAKSAAMRLPGTVRLRPWKILVLNTIHIHEKYAGSANLKTHSIDTTGR
jgi:hypothetical protein